MSEGRSGVFGLVRGTVGLALTGAQKVEALALTRLKRKLAETDGPPALSYVPAAGERPAAEAAPDDLPALLQHKLNVAMEQSQEQARADLNSLLLRQLLPDELRLLSALADGSHYAMCHLGAAPMAVGPATQRVLENLSIIGRAAGVRLLDATPFYVKRLRDLGLVESGPEDPALQTKYQMLETDTALRKAVEHIEKVLKLKPRIYRHTLRMSEFGKQFWATCQPPQE